MAKFPFEEITNDLPENWNVNDILSPDGESVGLTPQHGHNYLYKKVNEIGKDTNILRQEDKTNKEAIESNKNEIAQIKEQGVAVADTLPIGAQVMWDDSQPLPDNWEYVDTKIYNPIQHLINNDFQINQRGQSEYTSGGYGLDMWYLNATTYNPISLIKGGGILINKATTNQNIVRQYVDRDKLKIGKQYTLLINIESDKAFVGQCGFGKKRQDLNVVSGNKIYSYTFTLEESDIGENNTVDTLIINVDNRVGNAPTIKIFYADLFEGDIAYPHVKKTYAEDLMECRRYLRKTWIKYLVRFNATNKFECFDTNILRGMVDTPTVIKDNLGTIMLYFKSDYGTLREDELVIEPNNGILEIGATVSNDKIVDSCATLGSNGYILITCEPL